MILFPADGERRDTTPARELPEDGHMTARAGAAVTTIAGHAPQRAIAFSAAVLGLLATHAVTEAPVFSGLGQTPWVAAEFVLPLLYAFPGSRRLLDRCRWPVLAVQTVLTWVPLAVFGGRWETGSAGLLAGLLLLMVPGLVSWLAAGLLLAADLALRAGLTGLPWRPAWSGAVWVIVPFVVDTLVLFGMIRLEQIVRELDAARGTAAELAVASERLHMAQTLHAAVGRCLTDAAARAEAARQSLAHDAATARTQIAAVGRAAREAVAQARAVSAARLQAAPSRPAMSPGAGAVIGGRLAWTVLVVVLSAVGAQALNNAVIDHNGLRTGSVMAAAIALTVALQLRHSWSVRQGSRPRAWLATISLQMALVYMFFLPGLTAYMVLPGFLAGSVLLLVPSEWRWVGFAAVIASWVALFDTVPLPGITAHDRGGLGVLYSSGGMAFIGLLVYGLSRLAQQARELEGLRDELAGVAALLERLRAARDVHDLLGLGLSTIALKADLAGALIGRDDPRATAEMEEMTRICATVLADIRQITEADRRLRLADEMARARQILAAAGIRVRCDAPHGPLPDAVEQVLAPVLREAVTNILRHSAAGTCSIDVAAYARSIRLEVVNDGVPRQPATCPAARAADGGIGLANLDARVRSAGGRLSYRETAGKFMLTAHIPLGASPPA